MYEGRTPSSASKTQQQAYTRQECQSACLQRIIWRKCRCLHLELRLPYDDIDGSVLCGSLAEREMKMFLDPMHRQTCVTGNLTALLSEECMFLRKMIDDLACVRREKEEYNKKKLSGQSECSCPEACYSYE